MELTYIGLIFWTAIILIIIDSVFILAFQFLWYVCWGTQYDNPPYLFTYLSSYIVSPDFSNSTTTGPGSGLNSLTPDQLDTVTQIVYFAIVMTYLWVTSTTTPVTNAMYAKDAEGLSSQEARACFKDIGTIAGPKLLDAVQRAQIRHVEKMRKEGVNKQ